MLLLRRIAAWFHPAVEEISDPIFGPLRRLRESDDWSGEVPFDHLPSGTTSLALLIGNGKDRPSDVQREFFESFREKYAELWPTIAEALANDHPEHKTVAAVAASIDEPCLCIDPMIPGQPRHWSLQFTFDYPNEADLGYFLDFCEWEIVDISAVD